MADSAYEHEARRLSSDDLPLIPKFSCGDEWWEREVTDFLHKHAWEAQKRGDSVTTVFSRPKEQEILGFITTADIGLKTKEMKEKLGYDDWEEAGRPTVPAIHIIFFGVHRDRQGKTLGTEILLRLLESLASQEPDMLHRPRFIHLYVWKANARAVKFYRDNDFEELGERPEETPYFKGKTPLVSMVYNRFRKPD